MTEKITPIVSKKGQAFRKLIVAVEHPIDAKLGQVSAKLPVRMIKSLDKIAKRLNKGRTAVVIMLLDAMLAEMAAEGGEGLQKLLGVSDEGRDSNHFTKEV